MSESTLREAVRDRIVYHCDERKYDFRLGKACVEPLIDDIVDAIAAWNRRADVADTNSGNKPLTLDELKQMDGEPVWVQELPPYTTAGYKVLAAPAVNEYGDICFDGGDCYAPYDYGKTWLAYRRKPERSEG